MFTLLLIEIMVWYFYVILVLSFFSVGGSREGNLIRIMDFKLEVVQV